MPLPFPVSDLTKETTTTEGLGALFLDPSPPHRTLLSGIGAGVTGWFCVYQSATAWEVFEGQVTAGSGGGKDSVSRAVLVASSTGSSINFGSGTKIVYNTVPASQTLAKARALQELADAGLGATARTNLGAGATGSAVFAAATEAAGRTALGGSTFGGSVFGAADAAAARTLLGLLSAALRNVGVGASTEIPDRGLADARYQPRFPTDGSVKAPFYMSAAPVGWTRVTTGIHECAIRLVTTGGGDAQTGTGYEDLANGTTFDHVLTELEMPVHVHANPPGGAFVVASGISPTLSGDGATGNMKTATATASAGGGAGHKHVIQLKHANFLLAQFTG